MADTAGKSSAIAKAAVTDGSLFLIRASLSAGQREILYYVNIQMPIKYAIFGLSGPHARPGRVNLTEGTSHRAA
jgi:hypothetical protein